MKPDADNVQGLMAEAIDDGYSHLPPEDLKAMAEYLASLPPIKNLVISENQDSEQDW